jgi:signal transduction histidine kinase
VTVATAVDAGSAILTVSNSGPVIAPSEAQRLFAPFRRHGTERTGNSDRHGLGLSIVSAIATAHGATLAVRPHDTGGLCVEVKFPVASAGPGTYGARRNGG